MWLHWCVATEYPIISSATQLWKRLMSHIWEHLLIKTDSDNGEISYHAVIIDGTQSREKTDQNQYLPQRRVDKYWPDDQLWLVLWDLHPPVHLLSSCCSWAQKLNSGGPCYVPVSNQSSEPPLSLTHYPHLRENNEIQTLHWSWPGLFCLRYLIYLSSEHAVKCSWRTFYVIQQRLIKAWNKHGAPRMWRMELGVLHWGKIWK